MRQESIRLSHEREQMVEKIADNTTKIKQNKVLPYLVSKIVEVSPFWRSSTSDFFWFQEKAMNSFADSGRRQRGARRSNA
jgi:hypothetical protein